MESRYAPETRDHVVRVRMRCGALTLGAVQSVSTVLRPKNYKYYIMHDLASSPASLASPAPSLAEEGAGDARLPAFWVCVWPITTVIH